MHRHDQTRRKARIECCATVSTTCGYQQGHVISILTQSVQSLQWPHCTVTALNERVSYLQSDVFYHVSKTVEYLVIGSTNSAKSFFSRKCT